MITVKEIFCLNEQGRRANNEDSIAPKKGVATLDERLFIVCDGVGGENKGEVASEIVCDTVYEFIHSRAGLQEVDDSLVTTAVARANAALASYVKTNVASEGMSTTIALVFLGKEKALAAWCGDTRIHHIRNGQVIWKSRDHSLVGELVRSGEITEAESRSHPRRNVITRSLNAQSFNSQVDCHQIDDVREDDHFLLCTDGLLEQIDDDRLYKILTGGREENLAQAFLNYCEGKTRDNFSMYLVRLGKAKKRSVNKMVVLAFMVAVLIAFFAILLTNIL